MLARLFIVGIASLALACASALFFYKLLGASDGKTSKAVTHSVVVAVADLPIGAVIRPEDVRVAAIPQEFAPRTSFAKVSEVKDRVVTNTILKDEPVASSRLAAPGSGPGLAPMIPQGYRAVAVRVNDVIGVAGFIQPGMRVDVLASGRLPNVDDSVTRTILQNVVVLSAGQILQPEPKGQVINAQVVTLQVRPDEAEILALTSGEGRIQLVLRNSSDTRIEPTPGAHLAKIYGSSDTSVKQAINPHVGKVAAVAAKAPLPVTAALPVSPRQRTVEVIRGTTRSDVPMSSLEKPGRIEKSNSVTEPNATSLVS